MYVFYSFSKCHYFKKNKNINKVENPVYYSLGWLQQTMMTSSADHHDLSVVHAA